MSKFLRILVSIGKPASIVFSIIILASIVGAFMAFRLPLELEKEVIVLNYEHNGKFDYIAYQKATYTYGDLPLEPSPEIPESPATTPKYPADMIDSIEMNFTYRFVPDKPARRISEQVEIRAIISTGSQREEIILVPEATKTGDFSIKFPLDVIAVTSNTTTAINADVYTTVETDTLPIFESFSQSLTIQKKGPYLEVSQGLTNSKRASFGAFSYEQMGEFDYSIHMKSGSPFGGIILGPPQPEPPPSNTPRSDNTFGPGDTIYMKLFDGMEVTYSYNFISDKPVGPTTVEVEINAILENPGVWRKTFPLVPSTKGSDTINVSFPMEQEDFSHFRDVFSAIQKETGISVTHKITIKADVHTNARTPFGPIDEIYTQTLSTTLGGDTLQWEEEVEGSKTGTLEQTQLVPNTKKLAGFSITQIRKLSLIAGLLSFILLICFTVLILFYKPEELSPYDEVMHAKKKHKDVIVDVQELPESGDSTMIVPLVSLDALVQTADSLLKPVLHLAEKRKHTYCVIDDSIRYEYILFV
jgi:hypothetical protein